MALPTTILETERLYLREIVPEDAPIAYALNLDPEVLQYTGDDPFDSIEEAATFLRGYDHYRTYGFGRWGVIRKEDNVFLGWCGLKYDKEKDEFDIGFRFFKKYWNQGYATESALACLKLGFEQFKMPEIVGRARKENGASIQVLKKIGLRYHTTYEEDGEKWEIYRTNIKS